MKRILIILAMLLSMTLAPTAQNVTIHATNEPAATVFRSLIEQTGKNFVYSSDILKDVNVTIDADNKPLRKVLSQIFYGSDIKFKIKGDNVLLKRKSTKAHKRADKVVPEIPFEASPESHMLEEIVVLSRLEAPAVETSEIGAQKISAEEINNTPTLFGESDVIRTLQTRAGISQSVEGVAGMHVHGGEADGNLYMLENVPIYQINHFGGLFSAFNTNAIRYIDFYKSSIPAKYDGRLSSFMDVRLKNGSPEGHHGSFKLGLTSGAIDISGPISHNTTYLIAMRRSWFDGLTIPALAIINASNSTESTRFRYAFMDLNTRVSHRFSNNLTGFANIYYGDDLLKTGSKDKESSNYSWLGNYKYDTRWGNFVAQTGLNLRFNDMLSSEFTAAYTRCFSNLRHNETETHIMTNSASYTHTLVNTDNNINDWIFHGDFDWRPCGASRVRFGVNYVRHSFLPSRTQRKYEFDKTQVIARDSTWAYKANEANVYIEDDITLGHHFRANVGLHASLFNIDDKTHFGFSPRFSINFRPNENLSFKAAYSHTVQYVHQLTQSYLALPSDQWIPITGNFKPQNADKYSIGAYWQMSNSGYALSVEGYYKEMRHLVDYADEYYLKPPLEMWNARLTSGRGTSKGIDFSLEKTNGKLTGHVSYSLAWANRTFADKNGGQTYPARFDNRHTINISASWQINDKIQLDAFWTGHSGNRFTLMPQSWQGWEASDPTYTVTAPLKVRINNYQLPFYHRLDLACTVQNPHGYWTFSIYNAYNHLNTIAIRRHIDNSGRPVFQKVKLLPIIPSIAYTWTF